MQCQLELSVFRFDATTDFLPYYKKYEVSVDDDGTVQDVLEAIYAQDSHFGYPKGGLSALKINGKVLFAQERLKEVVEHFGKSFTLEPLSTRRATKDIVIDLRDFYERFDLLDAFVDSKDKPQFESYLLYHYASSVHDLLDDFYGDALFAFAYDMTQKHPEREKAILNVVAHEEYGVFHRVRLCDKIFPCASEGEKKIAALKNRLLKELPHANPLVETFSSFVD